MGKTELSDWFEAAAYSSARSLRLGSDLKNMPEAHWLRVVDSVETRVRMTEERIPVGWREMLATKVGRDVR